MERRHRACKDTMTERPQIKNISRRLSICSVGDDYKMNERARRSPAGSNKIKEQSCHSI